MEKKKKWSGILIVVLCVAAGILVSIGGVWTAGRVAHSLKVRHNRAKSYDDEYVLAQMMDYLEERYHEKFVKKYYNCCLGSWYGNYVEMGAWPEGKENQEYFFTVTGYPDAEGNLSFYDTYVNLRVEKEMENYFQPYINKYYEKRVSYWIDFSEYGLPADISIEELFKQKAEATIYIGIYVEQQEMDRNLENLESLAKELQDKKFRGELSVDLLEKDKSDDKLYSVYWIYLFNISDEKIEMTEEAY
ncbi:MAG: hypothetical protein NC489_43570 [Ruminococcus flavefaciens]|nr:hypothetical protein [Ruminococcus flavefaciens]